MNGKGLNARTVKIFILDHIIAIVLAMLIIFLSFTAPSFLTVTNWLNILKAISMKGVIAFGMTMVIIAGQIDLSIGSVVAIAGVIAAFSCEHLPGMSGMSVTAAAVIGMVTALLFAVCLGAFHGFFQVRCGMPAFIITLATQLFLYGLAGIICGGFPIAGKMPEWFNHIGIGRVGNIPIPAIILVFVFLVSFFVMGYTRIGRAVYAAGGNAEAARLAGINVMTTEIFCFAVTAVFATIGGFINSAQVLQATFNFGRGWETDVISAVVIGGTSMTGGVGRISGTMLGIIFIGVIANGMTLLDVSVYMQYVIRATLLFCAVLLSIFLPKLKQKIS